MEVRYFKIPDEIKELNIWCKGSHTWHSKPTLGVIRVSKRM